MGCFVNFGADWHGPGRILYGGHGAVVVGELDGKRTKRVEEMHRLLKAFEPDAVLTGNIWGYLWGKLGYGAMLFATALTEASIADALAEPRYNDVFRRIGNEVMAVAAKKGIRCEGFNGFDPAAFAPGGSDEAVRRSMAGMVEHNRASAKTHSGIYRDLAVRKRRTEVDAQVGMVVEQAREAGIPAPTLAKLVTLIHDIEEGRRPQAWATLDALC
jgi:2-dehydropantoate 2-reductase